ncbi:putative mitochondrial glycoprotein [Trypanosoma rangeli]|uniref:Putative mitochondrial glycoprotein n=1 Tax=Trypanosoma rangeli TaxID=5698 RepID=A0A422NJ89_TRYRA|nr:putative mitochondrial glycoprotein [Trypanosoma rangeli]RNF05558.1 putative mitochondrial glycoprotein [Trypanosoma rangeli]|eukprot:RNF05558.1 putative mitochondrial glycoprotein [Trypanosoma rangeli]
MRRSIRVLRHRQLNSPATPVRLLRFSVFVSSCPRQQQHARRFMSDSGPNGDDGGRVKDDGVGVSGGMALPRSALPPSDFPEHSFLKCIEKEMQDEALRVDKEEGPPPPPSGWEMYHAPGTSVFYGRRWWVPPTPVTPTEPRAMERHTIRVQLTTRDPSLDPECDVRGEHFPFSLFVQRVVGGAGASDVVVHGTSSFQTNTVEGEAEERGLYEQSIEVRADFVEGELVVDHVVFHGTYTPAPCAQSPLPPHGKEAQSHDVGGNAASPAPTDTEVHYNNIFGGYPGPNLDEVEEEVLDGIQAWLAERCIDDQFGEFVGQYSVWVEQMEYERWLRQLRDFVAA